MAVGVISSYDDVNSILLAGRADLCLLGRAHLYDPNWTLHAAAEQDYAGPGAALAAAVAGRCAPTADRPAPKGRSRGWSWSAPGAAGGRAPPVATMIHRRVALVTGAGRGIGRSVAVRLSGEGMRVALTARSPTSSPRPPRSARTRR